jgi:phosphoadenosine phosphosulfate reductase
MAFFTKGAFTDDPWAGHEIMTVLEWQARRDEPVSTPIALRLDPGFGVDAIAADLAKFGLIKISFPKFTDGRGYSMGWLLRTRYGYRGELRAVGDVLFDEMQFMTRCGFDAFEIVDAETLRLLKAGRQPAFDRFYQPGTQGEIPAGTRPWARRLTPAPNGNLG